MNEFELFNELWNRTCIECVVIYDKALDIAKKKVRYLISWFLNFEFLRKVIILKNKIVSCIFEYVLDIERLNVNSRVTRIEDQKWIKVERLFNVMLWWRVEGLKENTLTLRCLSEVLI